MILEFNKSDILDEIEKFDWHETYMIGEIPENNVWNNFATTKKLELEKQYCHLKMPKECSKHYMALNPSISNNLKSYLKPFLNKTYHYNFLKLTPGYNLWWHYDSYSTFVRYNNVDEKQAEKINRTIIMLTPWTPGQVLQIDNSAHINWKIGDTYNWTAYTWHGVGNFSFTDFVVMQITWL
jgi:hypothetical protein